MTNYQHILVAIDFSDEIDQVMHKALAMMTGPETRVSLIHVVEYSPYLFPPDTPLPIDFDLEEQFIERANERLDELAQRVGLTQASRFVEAGSPTLEIVRVALEQAADLIVIGSHGRHGLQRILGSTASGVLHTAPCDVLAVRIEPK
ncbi:MAG: universal stress protein [Candidatus Thiodiazotropha sp.]|jgi:universal stress protein A